MLCEKEVKEMVSNISKDHSDINIDFRKTSVVETKAL